MTRFALTLGGENGPAALGPAGPGRMGNSHLPQPLPLSYNLHKTMQMRAISPHLQLKANRSSTIPCSRSRPLQISRPHAVRKSMSNDCSSAGLADCVYYVAASVDGFIAGPNGSMDWLKPFEDGTDYGYEQFLRGVGTVVMGRKTFEVWECGCRLTVLRAGGG